MKLKELEKQDKDELSMIEVAHAILEDNGKPISFADLTNEMQKFLGDEDQEIRDRLPQFYTDMNVDGSFISLGNNVWGLRTWYPYDSVDEATVSDDEEENKGKKATNKVNAFLSESTDDDDVIDYDNDDPEDQDDFDDDDDKFHKPADDEENPNDDSEDNSDGVEGDLGDVASDDTDSDDEEN